MLSLIFPHTATVFRKTTLLASLLLVPALCMGQTFVQVNSNTVAADASSVNVTYTMAETAGNLNVVVVGWNDTSSSIVSVADDNTNNYVLVGTTAGHGLSQAIYYAQNIVLPNNATPTVTVTFNQTAGVPDVRILEYSGLSTTAPLDNWVGSSGVSTSADSGTATTSSTDLIFGAGTTASAFTGAGAGFTARLITSPFGDIVEDSNASLAAGSYNATATVAAPKQWVMQVAGFSVTGVTFVNPPTISPTIPITPATGSDVGGTSVTVTGTDFQPGAVVLFGTAPGGISGVNCTESGGTTITCLTPSSSDGAKDVTVVNVDGQSSSATAAYTFQNVTPVISTITPNIGPTNGGTATTITGSNFQGGARVIIGGLPAGGVVEQDSGTLTFDTPGLPVGLADVTVNNPGGGTATADNAFTYTAGTGPVNYVQRGGLALSSAAASVIGPLPSEQAAGNLNVVIIGWNDTAASVTAVTDAEGNTYTAALPVVTGTALRQVIYYAKNIVGDGGGTPNQITVTFDQVAQAPDVQILEYSGLDITSPLDAVAGNAGSGLLADSGPCTTTAPVEVIVAGTTVSSTVAGSGPGFNVLNITQPDGDSAEHQITSVAGSCQATAPLRSTGAWVIQTITLKAAQAPAPDFSLGAVPASHTVNAGSAAAFTISVTPVNGFNSAVVLTCDPVSLPVGASCAFNPGSVTPAGVAVSSALSLTTSPTTPVGTSVVTVTGTSGSVSHTTTVSLTVNPQPDFTVAASALAPVAVLPGGSSTSTVTIAPVHGFNSAVSLTCSVSPVVTPTPTCTFNPTPVAGGSGTSLLTVNVPASTPAGGFSITVTGTSGSIAHSAPLSLTINPLPNFTIAASALAPASVVQGASSTSTITIAPVNGFNSAVALTCSVTPVVTPPPTCALNPAGVVSGSGTSVLTVSTPAPTPPGSFTITVTGTAGAVAHSSALNLTVTGPPDFTVAASALSPASVAAGVSATSTITIAAQNGFSGAVTLSCSITPVVSRPPACSFNPASVANASGTSTMTVSTTAPTTASLTPQSRGIFLAMWLPIGGLALLVTGFTSRRKNLLGLLLLCLMLSGLIFLAACGGGSSSGGGGGGQPGTTAGSYTVTVTAKSGATTHTQNVTLTVTK